jgi:5-methylcytosine-specific restriction enzyme A
MGIPERPEVKRHLLQLLQRQGPMTPTEAYKALAAHWRLSNEEMTAQRAGGPLYEHEIRWARQELVVAGLMERPGMRGRGVWKLCVVDEVDIASPEEQALRTWPEGSVHRVVVNRYERNPKARQQCIAMHGMACKACGTVLEEVYGPIAAGRIHVHHISPLSEVGDGYEVDPMEDLVPLCPNCHFVTHLREPPLTLEQLQSLVQVKHAS